MPPLSSPPPPLFEYNLVSQYLQLFHASTPPPPPPCLHTPPHSPGSSNTPSFPSSCRSEPGVCGQEPGGGTPGEGRRQGPHRPHRRAGSVVRYVGRQHGDYRAMLDTFRVITVLCWTLAGWLQGYVGLMVSRGLCWRRLRAELNRFNRGL